MLDRAAIPNRPGTMHVTNASMQRSLADKFLGVLIPTQRIASLDGLRAISIALVLFAHMPKAGLLDPFDKQRWVDDLGTLGVRVFFIISGFLITRLLLEEQQRTGHVSLLMFYFRRTMRIFPAFYVYVLAVAGAAGLGWLSLPLRDFLYGLTYTMNFVAEPDWVLGHLWSLAVEEQFYLLWPATLVLLGTRRAFSVAVAVILLCPLVRFACLYIPAFRPLLGMAFPTVADPLAIGCLLAGAHMWLGRHAKYVAFLRNRWFWLLPPAVFVLNALPGTKLNVLVTQTLLNLCIAVVIDRWVRFPDGVVGAFLNAPAVRACGVLSYSLYLWQQLFLNPRVHSVWQSYPINLLAAFTCAYVSYRLIERPCLDLRARLERRIHKGADHLGHSCTMPLPPMARAKYRVDMS